MFTHPRSQASQQTNLIAWRDQTDIQSVVDFLTTPLTVSCDLQGLAIRLQMLMELMLYLNKNSVFSFEIDTGEQLTAITQLHLDTYKKLLSQTDEEVLQQLVSDYLALANDSIERQLQLKLIPPKQSAFNLVSYFTQPEKPLHENPAKLIRLLVTSKAQMEARLNTLKPQPSSP